MTKLSDMLSSEQSAKLKKMQTKSASKQDRAKDTFNIRIPDFVALDLETTGLNRREDRITEIGAVKYINGVETESFSTMINPMKPIPPHITELTGIDDQMVSTEPVFEEVADEIVAFIGKLAICGHRVDFDFHFLNNELQRSGRKPLRNWQIDTLSTARVVLDLKEGYALGKVARALSIPLENAHRALDDARASGDIAIKILPMLGQLPPLTRKQLALMAPFSFTKKILETASAGVSAQRKPRDLPPLPDWQEKPSQDRLINEMDLEEMFGASGFVSRELKNFTFRPEQLSYAVQVAQILNSGGCGAIEGGTGIGKSLGYVVPSALWAALNGKRLIISTNTRNLQDQLAQKELPLLKKHLGTSFNFTVLKGKGNYICLKGWDSFIAGETGTLSPREREAVMPLIPWVNSTNSGDIDEINGFNPSFNQTIWQLISAENRSCSACPSYDECFMQRARKRALKSSVVVINHALFYSDVLTSSSFTGEADAIIFDEAHHLESTGHRSLQVDIDTRRLTGFTDWLQEALNTIKSKETSPSEDFDRAVRDLKKCVKKLRKNCDDFLNDIYHWGTKKIDSADETYGNIATISYKDSPFNSLGSRSGLQISINEVIDQLLIVRQLGAPLLEDSQAVYELKSATEQASQLKADLNYLLDGDSSESVFWISVPMDEKQNWVKLSAVPLRVRSFLTPFWENWRKPLIFTSATLSHKDSLSHFINRAGLTALNPREAIYKGIFESDSAKFMACSHTPDPADPSYADTVCDVIVEIKKRYNRNTLVLFTSNDFLRAVWEALNSRTDITKSEIFAQNISGNRSWIQEQMSDIEGAVLLGSGSFWEGVDIPGKGCEVVIIPKLPFPVPSHPLSKALAKEAEESGRNGFIDYYMPEALLRFKQGAGRLLRHHTDRGVFLVMDSRIVSKSYGKQFIKLMPQECTTVDEETLFLEMDSFFGKDSV